MEKQKRVVQRIKPDSGPEFIMMQALQPPISDEDLERFLSYVTSVKWQFAETYAKTWPHEYTIRQWRPDLDDEFCRQVMFIRANGIKEPFYKAIRLYFYIDGYKYWAMGDPLGTT